MPDGCMDDLAVAARKIQARWPTAGDAWDAPYNEACVWYWAHGKRSFDGMGVAMATLDDRPGLQHLVEDLHDEYASGVLSQPSLLFFDMTDRNWREWELVGFGYHADYEPCTAPQLGCLPRKVWFVHEAGYHNVVNGSMVLATDDDLIDSSLAASIDEAGCEDIGHHDLSTRPLTVAHGRAWDLHVWLDPEGGLPQIDKYDPWTRWKDAPRRLELAEEAFFKPQTTECGCL
jgi:hypothetical protein